MIYAELGQYDQALDDYTWACSLDPSYEQLIGLDANLLLRTFVAVIGITGGAGTSRRWRTIRGRST